MQVSSWRYHKLYWCEYILVLNHDTAAALLSTISAFPERVRQRFPACMEECGAGRRYQWVSAAAPPVVFISCR